MPNYSVFDSFNIHTEELESLLFLTVSHIACFYELALPDTNSAANGPSKGFTEGVSESDLSVSETLSDRQNVNIFFYYAY